MVISQSEAAESLADVERVGRRTQVTNAYQAASPFLILWGLVWIAGYTATGLTTPALWGWVWLPAIIVGVVGSIVVGGRMGRMGARSGQGQGWGSLGISLICCAFMASVYYVFQPTSTMPYLVFPALVVSLIYGIVGCLGMPRFALIGAGVFAVVMLALVFAPQFMAFWIAGAAGGGLVLGGLWMRSV